MAVTKIWPVRERFDKVLDYAANARKTDADLEKLHALDDKGDMEENIYLLRAVAATIEPDYLLGMSSTRIVIKGKSE